MAQKRSKRGYVAPIKRTVTLTRCYGQRVTPLGEFADVDEIIYRPVMDTVHASQILRSQLQDESIVINNYESETNHYVMDVETFVTYATVTD